MGPLKGRPAWNEVAKPTRSANMIDNSDQGSSRPTAKYLSSVETPQRAEQAGGMRSEQTNQSMGRGGVGKSTLKTPPAEAMPTGLMDGGKY